MNADQAHKALVPIMFACAAVEVYAEFKAGNFPPRPIRFAGLAVAFMLLSLLSGASGLVAVVIGVGFLMALIIHIPTLSAKTSANEAGALFTQATGGLT